MYKVLETSQNLEVARPHPGKGLLSKKQDLAFVLHWRSLLSFVLPSW